jgi:hypothetical protein
MPRKRKKPEIKLILHPSPESLNLTEDEIRKKLEPLVRILARQAAREYWQKTVEASQAQQRSNRSDDVKASDGVPSKAGCPKR